MKDLEATYFPSAKTIIIEHVRAHADENGWCPMVASRLGPEYGFKRSTFATVLGRMEAAGIVEKRAIAGKGIVVRLKGENQTAAS